MSFWRWNAVDNGLDKCQVAWFDIRLIWNCEVFVNRCELRSGLNAPFNISTHKECFGILQKIRRPVFNFAEYLSAGSPADWARRESVGVVQDRKEQLKYLRRCPPVSMRVAPLWFAIAFPMTNPKNRRSVKLLSLKYAGKLIINDQW